MAGVRRRVVPPTLWLLFLLAAVTGCGGSAAFGAGDPAGDDDAAATGPAAVEPTAAASPVPVPRRPAPAATPNPQASRMAELPPAPVGLDALVDDAVEAEAPQPVALSIEDVGIDEAAIIAVGVNDDATFEVPPAEQVGWYRFGPRPGEAGSAVLAAHIAFDGVDGVFRHLSDLEVGAVVEVTFDDGTASRYRITEVTEYAKEALPDSLFARSGDPQLALITCGGTFNPQLRSYESNVVAIAVPI